VERRVRTGSKGKGKQQIKKKKKSKGKYLHELSGRSGKGLMTCRRYKGYTKTARRERDQNPWEKEKGVEHPAGGGSRQGFRFKKGFPVRRAGRETGYATR